MHIFFKNRYDHEYVVNSNEIALVKNINSSIYNVQKRESEAGTLFLATFRDRTVDITEAEYKRIATILRALNKDELTELEDYHIVMAKSPLTEEKIGEIKSKLDTVFRMEVDE